MVLLYSLIWGLLLLICFIHVRLCATPWTVAYQAPSSMGFSRQEYWSGLPLPSPKEGWALKNWCFQTVVLEKTLESPGRSNQSILKEINAEYSLEGLILKLRLQYFGHLMRRVDSLEKSLMLWGIGGRRRRGRQKMRWLDGITDLMEVSLSWWWTGSSGVL